MSEDLEHQLREFRRTLHSHPELSNEESSTADRVADFLGQYQPDELIRGLGGEGLAAIYESGETGPAVLVRCELDALPIQEKADHSYRSETTGVAHVCGHDGHMTMVTGLAARYATERPERGRVILLYQPAEETGEGAARVIDDATFEPVRPDYAVALHNIPGFELGTIVAGHGVFASASSGLIVRLDGTSSHAAEPQAGNSPAMAIAHLISAFSAAPQFASGLADAAQVTVIHARLGERAFGTSPGTGVVMATLRSHNDDIMEQLSQYCTDVAKGVAGTFGLEIDLEWVEVFPTTVNNPDLMDLVVDTAQSQSLPVVTREAPFPWSEDFGHFTHKFTGVLFGLGSGVNQPALHNPDFDFPDELLPIGTSLLHEVVARILKKTH